MELLDGNADSKETMAQVAEKFNEKARSMSQKWVVLVGDGRPTLPEMARHVKNVNGVDLFRPYQRIFRAHLLHTIVLIDRLRHVLLLHWRMRYVYKHYIAKFISFFLSDRCTLLVDCGCKYFSPPVQGRDGQWSVRKVMEGAALTNRGECRDRLLKAKSKGLPSA